MSLDLFQKVIFSAALDAGRRVSFVRRLTAAPDHPVSLFCPEGEYLKGFLARGDLGREAPWSAAALPPLSKRSQSDRTPKRSFAAREPRR